MIKVHSIMLYSYSHKAVNKKLQKIKGVVYIVNMGVGNRRKLKDLNSFKASFIYA